MFFWRRRHPVSGEELSAYLDGELEDAARARLEAHVEECAACRESLAELRAIRQALRDLARAPVPRSFKLREADLRPTPAPWAVSALGRATPLLSGVAVAAVVVFGVLVGIDLMGSSRQSAEGGPAALRNMSDNVEEAAPAPNGEGLAQGAEDGGGSGADESSTPAPDEEKGSLSTYAAEATQEGTPEPGGYEGPDARPAAPEPTAACEPGTVCEEGETPSSAGALSPTPATELSPAAAEETEDEGTDRLRVAEAAAAAAALAAGGSLALVWWRRRT